MMQTKLFLFKYSHPSPAAEIKEIFFINIYIFRQKVLYFFPYFYTVIYIDTIVNLTYSIAPSRKQLADTSCNR